jgi:hypothetical protein
MRITALVLGILGGLAAAALGMTWLSDANELKEGIAAAAAAGADTSEINKLIWASYLLIAGLAAGIAGGVMAMKRKNLPAAGILLAGAILPALLAPKSLVFTWILVLAAVFAFLAKPAGASDNRRMAAA